MCSGNRIVHSCCLPIGLPQIYMRQISGQGMDYHLLCRSFRIRSSTRSCSSEDIWFSRTKMREICSIRFNSSFDIFFCSFPHIGHKLIGFYALLCLFHNYLPPANPPKSSFSGFSAWLFLQRQIPRSPGILQRQDPAAAFPHPKV